MWPLWCRRRRFALQDCYLELMGMASECYYGVSVPRSLSHSVLGGRGRRDTKAPACQVTE